MATDEVAQDVSQVTDFNFHACRKFRIFTSGSTSSGEARNRLATSSHLGVTFALVNSHQMVCFSTKSLLDYKVTRENMNLEVVEFPMKPIDFAGVTSINDMGINSDGTLLALLHTHNNDVSVDVFNIKTLCARPDSGPHKYLCRTRVGTDKTNRGTVFEWNPAFPDTFAAASTDKSIIVTKIDVQNPQSQKLVGIGKFGATVTAISWSPKGKQLTVGDALGKVTQMKPEMEIVRVQLAPDHTPEYGKVTGLCWLATTEWLVSFERGGSSDHDAYLLRCKKEKPTEWMQFHELSYSSSKWQLPSQLLPATQLLVDWNVVLVGNSKTSEIVTVGKREDWQSWVPVEGEAIYLPTTASNADTVPVGISIDRTMTEEVLLKADGSLKFRPSPLVLCLTNDGVLTAHHVISSFPPHKPCQIPSQKISIAGLAAPKFSSESSAPVQQLPTIAPSTVFEQKPKPEVIATPTKPSTLFAQAAPITANGLQTPQPTSSSFFAASSSISSDPPAAAKSSAVPTPSINATSSKTPIKAPETPAPPSASTPPEQKRAEKLVDQKKILVEKIQKMKETMTSTKDAVRKMSFAAGNAKTAVMDCSEVVKASLEDSREVIDELRSLISSIEWVSERTKHTVKEMDFEIEEKMELVAEVADGERILEKLRDISETEKMMRFNKLEKAADMLNGKFADCGELIKKLGQMLTEKESNRKQAVLSPLRVNSNFNQLQAGRETEVALKVMRNVSKIIMDTRERIQRAELEFVHFQRDVKNQKKEKVDGEKISAFSRQMNEVSVLEDNEPSTKNLADSEVMKARKALIARIQKRGVLKTKNVIVESYGKPSVSQKKKVDPIDTSNLSNAILKLSMTPRRVMATSSLFSPAAPATLSSVRRDATTQADSEPIIKIVTVESPPKPASNAPVTSTPALKASTNSAFSVPSPKLTIPKEEPKTLPDSKVATTPASTSSSIFSGSLFGSKTTTAAPLTPAASTKSSIFGSPLSKTTEEHKQETQEILKQPKEEPQKVVEPVLTKIEEPPKVEKPKVEEPKKEPKSEEKTSEPVKAPEEKKEGIPKTPSFSFNTSENASKPTSSVFGGGIKPQTTPTQTATPSIFGAAAKNTTAAAGSSTSIFGGGPKTTASPFGSFGQTSQPAQSAAPATSTPTPAVSFSFNTAASSTAATAKPAGFGAFGAPASKPSAVFGGSISSASPMVPTVGDEGMEDDSMANGGGGGGGFMSGLGSSANTSGSSNPFAPKPSTGSAANSSWLFSGNASQQQQQKPSFSFNSSGAQQTASPTATSSVFGGAPKFGSQPVFGAKPFGGGATSTGGSGVGLSKNASIFGGAAASSNAASSSGGFAQFATGQKPSTLFGGAAGGVTQQSSSIFGGGNKTAAAPTSSIFGGGSTTNSNKPSSFTSWR